MFGCSPVFGRRTMPKKASLQIGQYEPLSCAALGGQYIWAVGQFLLRVVAWGGGELVRLFALGTRSVSRGVSFCLRCDLGYMRSKY